MRKKILDFYSCRIYKKKIVKKLKKFEKHIAFLAFI